MNLQQKGNQHGETHKRTKDLPPKHQTNATKTQHKTTNQINKELSTFDISILHSILNGVCKAEEFVRAFFTIDEFFAQGICQNGAKHLEINMLSQLLQGVSQAAQRGKSLAFIKKRSLEFFHAINAQH